MRIDRTATVNLCHPISRLLTPHREGFIPILMYHSIAEGIGTRHPYYETNTDSKVFARQMKFLSENGYSAVSLTDAVNSLVAGETVKKSVAITFDDGYRDFITEAFPVLAQYRFTATVFIVTGFTRDQRSPVHGKEYLNWEEVRELHSHGIGIGSHTVTHPELKFLDAQKVDDELGRSKQTIEDKIGTSVKSFSYPFAFPESDRKFTRRLAGILQNRGYEQGVSTIIGTARNRDNRFFLPRLPVNSWDDPRFFQAKLEGGYDWLHPLQYLSKALM